MAVHTVLAVDVQGRFLDARYGLAYDQAIAVIGEFRQKFGPDARVQVDGRDPPNQALVNPPGKVMERSAASSGSELAAAELGFHMIWESYDRASQMQAAMADRMIGQSVDMTRKFAEEMEGLRQRYGAALQQIDGIAFGQRMFEQERSYQHMAQQHQQLAEDARRANTRTDVGGLVEQLVVGAVRIIKAIGDEDARCSAEEAPKDTNR